MAKTFLMDQANKDQITVGRGGGDLHVDLAHINRAAVFKARNSPLFSLREISLNEKQNISKK